MYKTAHRAVLLRELVVEDAAAGDGVFALPRVHACITCMSDTTKKNPHLIQCETYSPSEFLASSETVSNGRLLLSSCCSAGTHPSSSCLTCRSATLDSSTP